MGYLWPCSVITPGWRRDLYLISDVKCESKSVPGFPNPSEVLLSLAGHVHCGTCKGVCVCEFVCVSTYPMTWLWGP